MGLGKLFTSDRGRYSHTQLKIYSNSHTKSFLDDFFGIE